jgi:hypothetical protein
VGACLGHVPLFSRLALCGPICPGLYAGGIKASVRSAFAVGSLSLGSGELYLDDLVQPRPEKNRFARCPDAAPSESNNLPPSNDSRESPRQAPINCKMMTVSTVQSGKFQNLKSPVHLRAFHRRRAICPLGASVDLTRSDAVVKCASSYFSSSAINGAHESGSWCRSSSSKRFW